MHLTRSVNIHSWNESGNGLRRVISWCRKKEWNEISRPLPGFAFQLRRTNRSSREDHEGEKYLISALLLLAGPMSWGLWVFAWVYCLVGLVWIESTISIKFHALNFISFWTLTNKLFTRRHGDTEIINGIRIKNSVRSVSPCEKSMSVWPLVSALSLQVLRALSGYSDSPRTKTS